MAKVKRIPLGSGQLYTTTFYVGMVIPADAVIETDDNHLGYIQGGATLTYKPEFYTAEDDLGFVKQTFLTKETASLKSGILTWDGNTLKRLCSTARVTEANGKRTVKIGGLENYDGKMYLIRFVHKNATDGDTRITILGNNTAGFEFAFTKDKETVIDCEFSANAIDDEGTLIIYEETIPALQTLTVASAAGATSGTTKITVEPTKATSSNAYMYKTAASVDLPVYNSICSDGYSTWDGTSNITAVTSNKILIVEVDASNTAKKAGIATVTSKA